MVPLTFGRRDRPYLNIWLYDILFGGLTFALRWSCEALGWVGTLARPRLQIHVSHRMLGLVLRWGTDGSLHCSGKYLWRLDCNYFSRAEVGNQLSSARPKRNDKHEQVHRWGIKVFSRKPNFISGSLASTIYLSPESWTEYKAMRLWIVAARLLEGSWSR